jgi:hypothetical protein
MYKARREQTFRRTFEARADAAVAEIEAPRARAESRWLGGVPKLSK